MPQVTISDAFVPGATVDDVLQGLTTRLVPEKGIRLERPSPDTLEIHHRYVPGWAVILGIIGLFFFLIGLLFFLVKTTETSTVIGREVEGGARFTATGSSSPEVSEVLRLRLTPTRPCPHCRQPMGRAASVCPSCGKESGPWIDHAGVRWTLGKVGRWQWFDEDVQAWRWYEDGTVSSPLAEIPMRLRDAASKPSKRLDPEVVSPPSQPAPRAPAPEKGSGAFA